MNGRLIVLLVLCVCAVGAVHYAPQVEHNVAHALAATPATHTHTADTCKVRVEIPTRDRVIYTHALAAIHADKPKQLHIDRADAAKHRSESLKGIPTKPGYDRDEYPPAMSAEGGKGADVKLVKSSVNRSEGAIMARELATYADGTCFEYRLDRSK